MNFLMFFLVKNFLEKIYQNISSLKQEKQEFNW